MKALCWHGKGDIRCETVDDPEIQDGRDAIIRVNSCAICGSDLHLYGGFVPGMKSGDVMGHETMGEVVAVGIEEVRTIKLSVSPNSVGDAAMDLINRIRGRGQEMGYPNMKIRWTHGRQKSAEFGTAREDAGDVLVFKTTKITSDEPLSQCDEAIRENSRNSLRDLIFEERG